MANYKTGAQRYNDRMDKIWEQARKNGTLENNSHLSSLAPSKEFKTKYNNIKL